MTSSSDDSSDDGSEGSSDDSSDDSKGSSDDSSSGDSSSDSSSSDSVRKVPAMKVVRFIMHVNLIGQRVHLDVAIYYYVDVANLSAYVQQLI